MGRNLEAAHARLASPFICPTVSLQRHLTRRVWGSHHLVFYDTWKCGAVRKRAHVLAIADVGTVEKNPAYVAGRIVIVDENTREVLPRNVGPSGLDSVPGPANWKDKVEVLEQPVRRHTWKRW
jgi:hypothetical protein